MFSQAQYLFLRQFFPASGASETCTTYQSRSKLAALLGEAFFTDIQGRTVMDFGCGEGSEAVELAVRGAGTVLGVDIREEVLEKGRAKAATAGVSNCVFSTSFPEASADLIVSLDAFEHFADPAAVLRKMDSLLKPGGEILLSFGPTWYHPMGGHLFSVFPWSHLIFSEEAQIRWRADFRNDGATRFSEVAGGLNQMSIARFEKLIASSAFEFKRFETVPIRAFRTVHNRLTREFTSAIVRCKLVRRVPA